MTALPAFMLDDRRLCRGSTLMWPAGDDPGGIATALTICKPSDALPCPFIGECLRFARANHEMYGVWGGRYLTGPASRKHRTPVEHGTMRGYSRHRRHGEDICEECRTAYNVWKADNAAKHPFRKVRSYLTSAAVPIRKDFNPYECHLCGLWHATTKRRAA